MSDRAWNGSFRGDPADIIDAEPDLAEWRRRLIGAVPAWHFDGACQGFEITTFFPERGQGNDLALQICGHCPVRQQCLDEALDDPSLDHGIRGGMTAPARKARRRLDHSKGHRA